MPPGYESHPGPFKVLVTTDGDQHYRQLKLGSIMDKLIHHNKIEPTVCIGVHSTKDRARDLKCSDNFASFLAEELMPFARDKYKLSCDPRDTTITGFSLGGLNAMYLGLTQSETFGRVLSQSGSFWYQGLDPVWMGQEFLNSDKKDIRVYMNVGILEAPDQMIKTNEDLYQVLKSLDYDVTLESFNSGHDYLSWGEYLARGLIKLNED